MSNIVRDLSKEFVDSLDHTEIHSISNVSHDNTPQLVEEVTETKKTVPKKTPQGCKAMVKNISRLAARNAKVFSGE